MLPTKILVAAIFGLAANIPLSSAKFRVVREWNYVNFTWPSASVYQEAIQQQLYIPENNVIAGLSYFDGYYYITLPRMKDGVPVTLGRIPAGATNDTSPLLQPFPSWELNDLKNCEALQNVQNVEIDPSNGHIWIIDGGRTGTITSSPSIKCQPKLVVYDIQKMEKVISFSFPENIASSNGSFLYDLVLDKTDQGYAYITDNSGKDPGIIVYSMKENKAWKIRHSQSMRADPNDGLFHVNDVTISTPLNLASIALGPRVKTNSGKIVLVDDREVFYAPISSLHLYSINSSVLRNAEFRTDNEEYKGSVTDHGLKSSQSNGMAMDDMGVLYYNLLASNSIARWDTSTPFQTGQRIIARDDRYLEWVNSFAFDDKGNLTILVNRMNRFIYNKLNLSEANFRLIASNVGGRSYLYDDSYNYSNTNETSNSTTAEHDHMHEPKAEPEPSPEPEPSAEPSPSTTTPPPSSAKSISDSSTKYKTSGAPQRGAVAFLSFFCAIMMFAF